MRSLRSLLVRSIARMLVTSCVVAGLSPALLSLSTDRGLAVVETAYAQTTPAPAPAATASAGSQPANNGVTTGANLFNTKVIDTANGLVQAAFMFMNPILMFASWLLSPDWTFGDVFNMRPVLHDLWVLVSNIVYVIFAIALLVIAVLNIFGNQTYQIKSVLPKFVGGIVIVPLSWFIVSAVLSIANILTASVLNLPYDTFVNRGADLTENAAIARIKNVTIPNNCVLDFEKKTETATTAPTGGAGGAGAGNTTNPSTGKTIDCTGDLPLSEMFSSEGSPYSILYVYAYGIFRIDKLQEITVQSSIKTGSDIIFGLFSGLLGFIIMLLLFIGIVFVLFTRVIQLWVFAILSPLFGLFIFLGENVLGDSSLKKYNIKEFISLAMVPVYISAALSFGMMLVLTVATSTVAPEETTGNSYIQMKTDEAAKTENISIGNNTDPNKRFSLTVKGAPLGLANGTGNAGQIGTGTIGKLVVMILALMVLWLAVMAGSKASEFTASAIEPIETFGKGIGSTVLKLPQYIPIIPTGDGKNMSYAGFSGLGNQIQSIGSAANQSGSAFGDKLTGGIRDSLWLQQNKAADKVRSTAAANMNALGGGNGIAAGNAFEKVVKKFAEESPSLADAVKNGPAIEALAETLSAMKGIAGFDAEELAKKMRAAKGNEQKFATLMHEIETKLPSLGRDNVMDWEGNLTQTQAAWAAMGGGQNNDAGGQTTTPPNPYVTPRSFVSTGTKLNAIQIDWSKPKDEIMPLIISQLPTDLSADEKKPNSEYMKGLRKWIDDLTGVPTAKKQEIIDELKKDGKHYVE